MAKKRINLDKALEKATPPSIPKVRDTPAGYPAFLNLPGRTWYERAMRYWSQTGEVPTIAELEKRRKKEKKNG